MPTRRVRGWVGAIKGVWGFGLLGVSAGGLCLVSLSLTPLVEASTTKDLRVVSLRVCFVQVPPDRRVVHASGVFLTYYALLHLQLVHVRLSSYFGCRIAPATSGHMPTFAELVLCLCRKVQPHKAIQPPILVTTAMEVRDGVRAVHA